jgi:hypothetical protein
MSTIRFGIRQALEFDEEFPGIIRARILTPLDEAKIYL